MSAPKQLQQSLCSQLLLKAFSGRRWQDWHSSSLEVPSTIPSCRCVCSAIYGMQHRMQASYGLHALHTVVVAPPVTCDQHSGCATARGCVLLSGLHSAVNRHSNHDASSKLNRCIVLPCWCPIPLQLPWTCLPELLQLSAADPWLLGQLELASVAVLHCSHCAMPSLSPAVEQKPCLSSRHLECYQHHFCSSGTMTSW